jgi:hypothetical protein
MKKSLFITAILCATVIFDSIAQRTPPSQRIEKYWSVGAQINAFNYFGDLNPLKQFVSTKIDHTRPNFGVQITKKMTTHISVRASLNYGRLVGNDNTAASPDASSSVGRYGRNLHFRNDIIELAVVGQYELFKNPNRFYRRAYWNPYVFVGIAGVYHNPKAKAPESMGGGWVALRPLGTEGQGKEGYAKMYSNFVMAFPLGIGVRFRLNDRWDLSAEVGGRILTTDHIDDVGGNYPNLKDLDSELARRMSNRTAEPTNVFSGNTRDIASLEPKLGGLTTFIDSDGKVYPLLDGREPGSVRGSQGKQLNDFYLVTGVHVNYILTTRRHPRLRR